MWRTRCALPTLTVAPTKKSNLTDKGAQPRRTALLFLIARIWKKVRGKHRWLVHQMVCPCLAALGWSPAAKVARLLIIVGVAQLLFNVHLRR